MILRTFLEGCRAVAAICACSAQIRSSSSPSISRSGSPLPFYRAATLPLSRPSSGLTPSTAVLPGTEGAPPAAMVLVDLGLIVSLKLTFMELDWNGTGLLTMEKLGEWCVRNGYQEVTMTTLQNMIRMVDTTYSQAVEFWEFLAIQIYMRLELQSTGIQVCPNRWQ